MDLLIIVSTAQSRAIAEALAMAARRAGINWGVFVTNDGVRTLSDPGFAETLKGASKAIACQDSWRQHMGDSHCPIEAGSQTSNSALVGIAAHIVSL